MSIKLILASRSAGIVLIPLLTLICWTLSGCQPDPLPAPPPEQGSGLATEAAAAKAAISEVEVMPLQPQQIPRQLSLPARVSALRLAEVRPQVGGILARQYFQEGKSVQAGELLYQIEDQTYRLKLEQAQAELAIEQASLLHVAAQLQRAQKLWEARMVTRQELDLAQANHHQVLAKVTAREAQLKAAKLDLQRTQIRAPISGRIGRSLVSEGSLVAADQVNALARIQQLEQVYIDIQQASQHYLKWQQQGAGNLAATQVQITLDSGQPYPHRGQLVFSDNQIDSETSALLLRARLANPNGLLLPGMSVQATLSLPVAEPAFLIPQNAVQYTPRNQAYVWIVKNKQVQQRLIQPEQTSGSDWLVRQGLQSGEQLVVSGFARLQEQQEVRIKSQPLRSQLPEPTRPAQSGSRG